LGLEIELSKKTEEVSQTFRQKNKDNADGETRPPVVAVMGHVDHGKTSLLDAIRESEVAKREQGGITQHISAYQIKHNKRLITFLDTPGHEAFAALREHGAQLTDLIIIVVAADDGVKPQTVEAIRFARKAGVKIIVAINKIDKDGADSNRIKQQLAENDVMVEGWGGDTVVVEVSAKTKQGINQLLDMVLLVADVEELRAVKDKPAAGLVIESHMEQGRGPVAVALVDEGTIKNGDSVVAGTTYAKVRSLEDTNGKSIESAGPSTPVIITGFKELPDFGNEFYVMTSEKQVKAQAQAAKTSKNSLAGKTDLSSSDLIRIINRSNELTELNILVKADVQGSLVSVIDSLKTLDNEEVAIRVVNSGIGAITENDIHMARTSGAVIYGFNVSMDNSIKRLAMRDKVSVRLFNVIYELIDDVKAELTKLLAPEIVESELGQLTIKGIFKTTKTEVICGGEVTKGKLTVPAQVRIERGKELIAEAQATNLKRAQQDAKEVVEGEMCGVSLKTTGKVDVQEGDRLKFYTTETVARSL
ncbi:MAG: translation initiation factor IF-2, partial [Minisyncoccia bacterium]